MDIQSLGANKRREKHEGEQAGDGLFESSNANQLSRANRHFLKGQESNMVEGTLPATLLHALVSTLHRLQTLLVLSKVDATEPIDDFSEPEEIHREGTLAMGFTCGTPTASGIAFPAHSFRARYLFLEP